MTQMNGLAPVVACELTSAELRERKVWLQGALRAHIRTHQWLHRGLHVSLAYSPEAVALVGELILLEAQCCPFLRFDLQVEPAARTVELRLTGPEGTVAFLRDLALVAELSP